MATIIDSLVVTLGLDASGVRRGWRAASQDIRTGQNQVRTSTREASRQVSKSANEMGKAIQGAARQFAIAFLGFTGAVGFTKFMGQLNSSTRSLGLMARNLKLSAAELRNWNDVAEIAGSTADSMSGFLGQIAKNQYDLRTRGSFDWIKQLNSFSNKVSLTDQAGELKKVTDVAMELSTAFAETEKRYGRLVATQRGLEMGIDPSVMNVLMQGPDKLREMLAREKGTAQLSDESVAAADRLGRKWTQTQQRFRDVGMMLLEKLQPLLERLMTKMEQWLGSLDLDQLSGQISDLVSAVAQMSADISEFVSWAKGKKETVDKIVAHPGDSAATWLRSLPGRMERRRQQNDVIQRDPVLFKLNRAVRSNFTNDFPKSISSLVDGLGLNDERTITELLTTLENATGKSMDASLDKADVWKIRDAIRALAEQALPPQSAPAGSSGASGPAASARGAGAGASAVNGATTGANVTNTLHIDNITIQSGATDGRGLYGDFRRELERRHLVAQVDTGLA